MEASFCNTLQMYCNNATERTIVNQNKGRGTLSDRVRYLIGQGGYLIGQVGQVRQVGQVGRPSQPPQLATTASHHS